MKSLTSPSRHFLVIASQVLKLSKFAATLALIFGCSFINAEEDLRKDPEIVALLGFVSDATTLDAMFYSVRDYCTPYVGKIVIWTTEQAWKAKTNTLLDARDKAMERYADILRQQGHNDITKQQLQQATADIFEKARANNKVLRKLMEAEDRTNSCGNSLGSMNSSSFSFERLAPRSYEAWKRNFKP